MNTKSQTKALSKYEKNVFVDLEWVKFPAANTNLSKGLWKQTINSWTILFLQPVEIVFIICEHGHHVHFFTLTKQENPLIFFSAALQKQIVIGWLIYIYLHSRRLICDGTIRNDSFAHSALEEGVQFLLIVRWIRSRHFNEYIERVLRQGVSYAKSLHHRVQTVFINKLTRRQDFWQHFSCKTKCLQSVFKVYHTLKIKLFLKTEKSIQIFKVANGS